MCVLTVFGLEEFSIVTVSIETCYVDNTCSGVTNYASPVYLHSWSTLPLIQQMYNIDQTICTNEKSSQAVPEWGESTSVQGSTNFPRIFQN